MARARAKKGGHGPRRGCGIVAHTVLLVCFSTEQWSKKSTAGCRESQVHKPSLHLSNSRLAGLHDDSFLADAGKTWGWERERQLKSAEGHRIKSRSVDRHKARHHAVDAQVTRTYSCCPVVPCILCRTRVHLLLTERNGETGSSTITGWSGGEEHH